MAQHACMLTFDMYFSSTILSLGTQAGSSHNASMRENAMRYASQRLPKLALFPRLLSLRTANLSQHAEKTCATSASAASHFCSTRLPAQKIFGLSISSQRERMAPCNLVGRRRLQILRIFAHTGAFKTIASVSIK
jgi:hypothetical protein